MAVVPHHGNLLIGFTALSMSYIANEFTVRNTKSDLISFNLQIV